MRFYESTSFFLRVIIVEYYSKELNLAIKLIPMFHIAEEAFYDSVLNEINQCDKILYEGFKLHKFRIFKQIGKYTELAKTLDMVSQFEYFTNNKIQVQKILADLSGEEAELEWNRLKLIEKIKFRIINPIKFKIQTYKLTRKKLSKEFMHSAEEAFLAYGPIEEKGNLQYLISKARDLFLEKTLEKTIENTNKDKLIGVMYGAGHMRRVETFLTSKYDFKIKEANFLKVYNL